MRKGILAGALLLMAALAAPLQAHMSFEKSEPAVDATVTVAPRQLQVWFSQEPDPAVSKLEMTGAGGPVPLVNFHTMPDKSIMAMIETTLPDGRYTVRWQSAGDDGHIQTGEYAFTVRRAQ